MKIAPVGRVEGLYRYPVKSFAGERLEAGAIERYGLYGDRSHAFVDETKSGWDRYVTARQLPAMLGYRAAFDGEGTSEAFPKLKISAADGRGLEWGDPLGKELEKQAGKPLTPLRLPPKHPELMAVDSGGMLIVTDRTLRMLESLWGKPLDVRRFRPNLYVALSESAPDEREWVGKRLLVGTAELMVEEQCERCAMITIDPDTQERDPSLLKLINEHMDLMFGVYASVRRTGQVRVGDEIQLMEP